MEILEKISTRLDRFNIRVGQGSAWLALPIIAIIMLDVVSRRFFTLGSVALQEMEWHLHAILFLFCAGYTYLHDGHVRVDLIRSNLSDRKKAWIELIGCAGFLIPYCLVMVILGIQFVQNSFALNEISDAPNGLPYRYIIKSVLPIAFFFLMLQAISIALRQFLILFGSGNSGKGAK